MASWRWVILMIASWCGAMGSSATAHADDQPTPNLSEPLVKPEGLEWLAVPMAKFNNDTGFVYGAQLLMTSYSDAMPWDWRLKLKLRHSTTNRHRHTLLFDMPHSFGTGVRFTLRSEFLKIDDANFFGLGNNSVNTGNKAIHRFGLTEPSGQLLTSFKLVDDLFIGVGIGGWYTAIDAREGSLLEQERPLGWDGGWGVGALLTVGIDSRDHEIVPRNGYFGELYLKPSLAPGNDAYFTVMGMTHQAYISPARWLVFAQRLMVEHRQGDVPLSEMGRIGGTQTFRGMGGVATHRGFVEGRFLGQTQALSNTEIRTYLPPLFQRLTIGAGPFLDVSRVLDDNEGPLWEGLHVSGGAEVSLNWKEAFVIRFNYAVSNEEQLFYIQGQHMF